jgi:DNA-binding MarR family transcriptional regulator
MKSSIRDEQYRSLAALRYYVRAYLRNIEMAANSAGLEYQQYGALLAIRAVSPERKCTIRVLSDQLLLRHHSTVELVDRMQEKQLVRRTRDNDDHRQVCLELLPRGEKLLATVVQRRLREVNADGRNIIDHMQRLLAHTAKPCRKKSRSRSNRKRR